MLAAVTAHHLAFNAKNLPPAEAKPVKDFLRAEAADLREINSLIRRAKRAALDIRRQAQARYSGFHVGAALIDRSGEIITGANVESSSYGLTICAERVALTYALTHGMNGIIACIVAAEGETPVAPCGACRQLIHDYAPDSLIIMLNTHGDEEQQFISDLLPMAFTL